MSCNHDSSTNKREREGNGLEGGSEGHERPRDLSSEHASKSEADESMKSRRWAEVCQRGEEKRLSDQKVREKKERAGKRLRRKAISRLRDRGADTATENIGPK